MPSALETLVKILRLEQETGYKNTAVIGGLESYVPNWKRDAHQQAKTSQQHALVEELSNVMSEYGEVAERLKRQNKIRYILGRITGRVDPDPIYAVEWEESPAPPSTENELEGSLEENTSEQAEPQADMINSFLEVDQFVIPKVQERVLPPAPKPRRSPRKSFDLEEAFAVLRQLQQSVSTLKGIGQKRAEQLALLGISTLNDLIFHFPRRYDDYTRMAPFNRLPIGQQVTAVGAVAQVTELQSRQGRAYLLIILEDCRGKLRLTFFNQTFLKRVLKPGMQITVAGKVEIYQGQPSMTNPEWEAVDQQSLHRGRIVPIYPLTKGITTKVMRKLIHQIIEEWVTRIPDYVPASVLERTEMVDLGWALKQVHFPSKWEYVEYAKERLAFDELLILQLGVLAKRQDWQSMPSVPLTVDDEWLETFIKNLPYPLTNAQLRAIAAIREDVAKNIPMNRLLQGDVGSGKTVVATIALAMAVANGKQAAIMAPTSILAEQHYQSICAHFEHEPNIHIRLLTGATSESERREIYLGLEEGTIQIIIGTHTLIQQRVTFANLGLAVIDEQHRFGVEERGALRGKGTNPHILVMTATPIPRTLALTMFADLDLTILDEMPPGRTPIETRVIFENERHRAYNFIHNQINQGRQAFIIYPLIEASDKLDIGSAVEAYEDLRTHEFRKYRLGLLHGRLSAADKDQIMAAFASGEIQILVSTTVIEVGINVPNATVMMIETAERFGLAQLHQLRGRVGRGEHQSYCLLMADPDNLEAMERLQALERTNDGFELAELDWKLRGPGDLLGTRQAGLAPMQMGSVMNVHLVELAQQESRAIFAEDPALNLPEHALLAQRIYQLQQQRTDLS